MKRELNTLYPHTCVNSLRTNISFYFKQPNFSFNTNHFTAVNTRDAFLLKNTNESYSSKATHDETYSLRPKLLEVFFQYT